MTDLEPGLSDLASCDREPIHIPGAVQGHGVLLAVSEPDHVVRMTSANSASLLGVGPEGLLGQRLADVVAGDLVPEEVTADRMSDDPAQHYPLSTTLLVDGRPVEVDVLLHRADGLLVIELEPGVRVADHGRVLPADPRGGRPDQPGHRTRRPLPDRRRGDQPADRLRPGDGLPLRRGVERRGRGRAEGRRAQQLPRPALPGLRHPGAGPRALPSATGCGSSPTWTTGRCRSCRR